MKKSDSGRGQAGSMTEHDVFILRLNLLIIMINAALKEYPLGEFRKKAANHNASELYRSIPEFDFSILLNNRSDHFFKERIKLLCVMSSAIFQEGYPLGKHRREAVLDNILRICDTAFPGVTSSAYDFLKVA